MIHCVKNSSSDTNYKPPHLNIWFVTFSAYWIFDKMQWEIESVLLNESRIATALSHPPWRLVTASKLRGAMWEHLVYTLWHVSIVIALKLLSAGVSATEYISKRLHGVPSRQNFQQFTSKARVRSHVRMGFVVGKVALLQVYLRVLGIFQQARPSHLTCYYVDNLPPRGGGLVVFNLSDSHWSEQNVRRMLLSPIAPVSRHLSSTRRLYKWCDLIKLLLTGPGIAYRESPAQPYTETSTMGE